MQVFEVGNETVDRLAKLAVTDGDMGDDEALRRATAIFDEECCDDKSIRTGGDTGLAVSAS